MSKVSDFTYMDTAVHRNGTMVQVMAKAPLGIGNGSGRIEAHPKSPIVSNDLDKDIFVSADTNADEFYDCEDADSTRNNADVPQSTSVDPSKSDRELEKVYNTNDADSECTSTETEDPLNFLIDSLPVSIPPRDCMSSNDDSMEGNDRSLETDGLPSSTVLKKQHSNTYAPRETSRGTLLSMGSCRTYCGKHYLEHRSSSMSPMSLGDLEKGSPAFAMNASGSPLQPSKANIETNAHLGDSTTISNDNPLLQKHFYISRTLQQLEDATKNWFARENCTSSAAEAATRSPAEPPEAIDLFSLQYNEATVSTIAAWVAGGSTRKRATPTFHRPIIDRRFRSCSVCGMYGHYEVECQSLTIDLMIKLSRIISGEAAVTNEYCSMKVKKHSYDVLIEKCDGFLIEQRSNDRYEVDLVRKDSEKLSEDGTNVRIENQMEMDGFEIREGPADVDSCSPPISESSVLRLPEVEPEPIQLGSLVTWFLKESDSTTFAPESIIAGSVEKIESDTGRVQVKVLRVIHADSKSDENHVVSADTYCSPGDLVWVVATTLYIVNEQNHDLHNNTKISPASPKRVRKAAAVKRPRTKKLDKGLMKKLTRVDWSKPESLSKKAKGGRKPNGLVWDEDLGVWVLPTL